MSAFTDQLGRTVILPQPPRRVISLVPSQTELLYTLGLDPANQEPGYEVVGITKFCIHPTSWFREKTRVGGTKDVHPDRVHSLRPDLILANKEENDQQQIEELARHYPVWISDVKTLPDALDMIRSVGDLTGRGQEGDKLASEIARRFAHLTYRGEAELDDRFGNDAQGRENPTAGGRYAVQSYLEHQGGKLAARFDAGTYVALTDALSSHDVGRGRGGVHTALAGCPVPVVVGGITSDRLYPLRLQEELAELLPGCQELNVVDSIYGHDGFLVETDAVGELIRRTLELASR